MKKEREFFMNPSRVLSKFFILAMWYLIVSQSLHAQTGPGGVGVLTGTGTLKAWYKADAGVTYDGTNKVSDWRNTVNVANLDIFAAGTLMPEYVSTAQNGKPAISFVGSNRLTTAVNLNSSYFPSNAATTFIISKADNTSQNSSIYGTYPLQGNRFSAHLPWAGNYYFDIGTCCSSPSRVFSGFGAAGNYSIWSFSANSAQGKTVYKDHTQVGNVAGVNTYSSHASHQFQLGEGYSGDIAEMILFTERINSAQRNIITNYLSAKYNIALAAGDIYSEVNYSYEVCGIGQEADGSNTIAASAGFYIQSNGNFDDGDYLLAGHNNSVNDGSTGADVSGSVTERWKKDWYLEKTGSLDAQITFDLREGIADGLYPGELANYVLLYRAGTSGNYSEVTTASVALGDLDQIVFDITDDNLLNGYYTLGSKNSSASPVKGKGGITFYAWLNDAWDRTDTWSTQENIHTPNGLTPSTSPTAAIDKVVIKNGVTVSVNTNNKVNASLEVRGSLNLQGTDGHQWDVISGNGRILLETDNFPSGDATQFITSGQGQGTVVYQGAGFDFNTSREFYNLEINLDASNSILILKNDLDVNGNLYVNRGVLKINDAASTTALHTSVDGNVWIQSGGAIETGTGNARHEFNLYGNFTNNGSAKFTNRTTAVTNSEATNGITDFNLLNTAADQAVQLNGTTNFYRIEINKGTDDTYVASIDADDAAYFNLFGYANQNHTGDQPYRATNSNALGLIAGTVKLGANVTIGALSNSGNYDIPERARLWIDGATVLNNGGSSTVPYGTLQVSAGLFESKVSSGICTRKNGVIKIEGGVVNTNVIRTSVLGSSNVGGYVQSGGTMNLVAGSMSSDYYRFSMTYPGNVFNMSGGTLHIHQSGGKGGIFINSDPTNVNVTGGTLICDISTGSHFNITSRAPFYNVRLTNTAGNSFNHVLSAASDVGSTNENLGAQPLVVLNDLSIEANSFLYHSGQDITVGRNMSIAASAQRQSENGNNNYGLWYRDNAATRNTLTFNGTQDAEFYIGRNADDSYELYVWNMTVNKPVGKKLTIKGDPNKEAANVGTDWHARLLLIQNDLNVDQGILDQGKHSIRLYGPLNVKSEGQAGEYIHGTTHIDALIMFKDADIQINTEKGAILGNIKMNPAPNTEIITLTSDVLIKRISYYHGRINMGPYNLKLDYLHRGSSTDPYRVTDGKVGSEMFYGDGNASDGGFSMFIPGVTADNSNIAFPVGVWGKYTPVKLNIADVPASGGYVTVVPVDAELQTTDIQNGGNILSYYWKISHTGFTTDPNVKYELIYNTGDVPGQENLFVPGKVLSDDPYSRLYIDDVAKVVDGSNLIYYDDGTGGRFPIDNASYTAGRENRFTGSVSIFYTRDHGNSTGTAAREPRWQDRLTWTRNDLITDINSDGVINYLDWHDSRQPACPNGQNMYPEAGDVVVIGWVPWTDTQKTSLQGQPHGVWIDNTQEQCAELVYTQMLDAGGNPTPRVYRSNFQFRPTLCINNWSGELTTDLVKGEGMFWCRIGDPDFSLMDMGDFVANDSSYIVYENFSSPRTINNIPETAPNLMLANNGWGANNYNINLPSDIVTNGNFEILGNANIILNNTATGNLTIGRDLVLFETNPSEGSPSGGGAQLLFQNNGTPRTVSVARDIVISNRGGLIAVSSPNTTVLDHNLSVGRNIYQKSAAAGTDGIKLWTASNQDRITLTLNGAESMTYTYADGDVPDLYRMIVNKGADQSTTAHLTGGFTLNGPTSGVAKALELQNGMLILDNPGIAFNLTSGNDDFMIGSTTGLEIRQGVLTANGNSGIILDGTLDVNNGSLDMSGGNNNIEYSASGNAVLEIGNGSLTVGGQVRGPLAADEGILKYRQTGGTVIIGQNSATEGSRGVLEVHNTGSEFTFTGGALQIVRQQSSPLRAALHLLPDNSTIGSGMTIQLGNVSTPASQDIGIRSSVTIPNLVLDNSSGNNPNASLWVEALDVDNDLQIAAGSTFSCQNNNVSIGGNLINNGTYSTGTNTTYFNGTSNQQITGTSTTAFHHLSKDNTNQLDVLQDITINGNLILNGSLYDNNNSIYVKGDFANNGAHLYGGSGPGIHMNGTLRQNLSGTGSIGLLRINNAANIKVTDGSSPVIVSGLELGQGVLDIGGNLLTLEENATITAINPFGESNMIQTTKSYVDAGVKKYFSAFAGPGNQVFVFPMGSNGVFTPVTFDVTSITSTNGNITVKASHEVHPTIVDDSENPDVEITDAENALQYYWILRSENMTGFSGTVKFAGRDDLALSNSASYSQSDYITARLLNNGSYQWDKFGQETYDETTDELTFTFSGTNDLGISGDYTAGAEPQTATKKGAIPDEVPVYRTIADGNWADPIWTPVAPAGGPRGARVEINHTVVMSTNFISSYTTTINNSGRLSIGSTYGHRLGDMFGTGTLHIEDGGMPSASFNDFIKASGGTFDFDGVTDYSVLSNFIEVNNVTFTGTGERQLPNSNLTIHGDVLVKGTDATLNLVNLYNQSFNLEKDLTLTTGSFTAGIGAATIIFDGSMPQSITGGFTGSNGFNNLTIDNGSGLMINNPIEINNTLNLTNGLINTSAVNTLTITNAAAAAVTGGNNTSYVNGPLRKRIPNNDTFLFPVGRDGRYGNLLLSGIQSGATGIWEAEYFNHNPGNDGFDPSSYLTPLNYVSKGEYWRLKGPAAAQCEVTVRWDGNSGVSTDASTRQNLRIVEWTAGTPDEWQEAGDDIIDGGATSGTIRTTSLRTFNAFSEGNYFTWGSITPSLVNGWIGGAAGNETDWFTAANWSRNLVPDITTEIEIEDVTHDPIISGNAFCADATLNNNAIVRLLAGSQMTIDGNLVNNGTLQIENNNTDNMASFINNGTITGTGNEQVKFDFESQRYWYIGMPLDGVTGADMFASNTARSRIYAYNGGWVQITSDVYNFDADPLNGYAVSFKDPESITYSGRARYGNYSKMINTGWQLVANPYPTFLDVEQVGDWNFNNVSETVYTRTTFNTVRDVATYNRTSHVGVNGGSRYIAPMQSFWVKCSTSGAFGVNAGARVHHSAMLKSAPADPSDVLRLELDNGLAADECAMVFRPTGSPYFSKVDSWKKLSGNKDMAYLYTIKQGKNVAVNLLPEPEVIKSVRLGYSIKSTQLDEMVIRATNLHAFDQDVPVYLEDKVTGQMIDLRATPEYPFTPLDNENTERFVLHFEGISTGLEPVLDKDESGEEKKVLISAYRNIVVVKVEDLSLTESVNVSIYSIKGEMLVSEGFSGHYKEFSLPFASGHYVVKVKASGHDDMVINSALVVLKKQ